MSSSAQALANLYQSHREALLAHLQRVLGDFALAQDVAQQAGLKLLELTPAQLEQLREPRAFLFHVATNLARDHLRRRLLIEAGAAELERNPPLGSVDPEAQLSLSQELEQVQQAIDTLPQQARRVLLLARVEGLSHKQIAARLQVQPKTVENHLSRAVAGLLQRLKQDPKP